YCDLGPAAPLGTDTRRAYRSVLDILFHALVRYAAPVLVFTAEEVWGTRYPDASSVHLLEWPEIPLSRHPGPRAGVPLDGGESGTPDQVRGDDLAEKWAQIRNTRALVTERIEPLRREKIIRSSLEAEVWLPNEAGDVDFEEVFITSTVHQGDWDVKRTENHKCGRCWRHLPEVAEDGALCNRCETVLDAG
ncbi:MAG: class I tRNA ligase family protein, partial [Sphingopyxis sp.]